MQRLTDSHPGIQRTHRMHYSRMNGARDLVTAGSTSRGDISLFLEQIPTTKLAEASIRLRT